MPSLPFLSLFLLILMIQIHRTSSAWLPVRISCYCPNTTATFDSNSTYQTNLDGLLSSLSSNATRPNGFYNTTAGGGSAETIYGSLLCRGDVTTDMCKTCVNTAVSNVTKTCCPRYKEAIIWYDECTVRYSNKSFFGQLDEDVYVPMHNTRDIPINKTGFMQVLGNTLNALALKTASGGSEKKFATMETNFTSYITLYTLAQCTPDLTGDGDCTWCLAECMTLLPGCCDGKQGGRIMFPSCVMRYEIYLFYRTVAAAPPPETPAPLLSPPAFPVNNKTTPDRGKKSSSSKAIVAILVPLAATLVLMNALGLCLSKSRTKKKLEAENVDITASEDFKAVESLQYEYSTLQVATSNFSDANKIGEGGCGDIYKGLLPNGQEIAVKRLTTSSVQGEEQFKNEVALVAKLQHRNLVRLLGFCLAGEEKLLVYEFVPNKSLDYFLFDPEKKGLLDWSRRYKIIMGIARGMLYLHEDSRLRIIHRDLKPSNILLDVDMNPKIADFGMSRIIGEDQSQANTNKVVGTVGYMSPEYAMHGHFSMKSDVYSFGMLVLEIVSGWRNSDFHHPRYGDLLSWLWELWSEGMLLEFMDPSLGDLYSSNEVRRCIHLGLLCVDDNMDGRPTMASIVLMLSSQSTTMPPPHQPTFFTRSRTDPSLTSSDQSTIKSMPCSANDLSFTEPDAR
ncbi:hypothetical protein Ancab_040211 [Ancistrocladus abbreviatus]